MSIRKSASPDPVYESDLAFLGMAPNVVRHLMKSGQAYDVKNGVFEPFGAISSRVGITEYTSAPFSTYSTGTVAVTNGSAAIVGTNTVWDGTVLVGSLFHLDGDDNWYKISVITDDTHITLDRVYGETTASGESYSITVEVVTALFRFYMDDGTKKFIALAGEYLWDIPDAAPAPAKIARYKAGTIAVTNANATVTGTDTLWAQQDLVESDWIEIVNVLYEIDSVDTNTSITLKVVYAGSTDSGLSYKIYRKFTPNRRGSMASFKNRLYIANGVDALQRYDGDVVVDAGYESPTTAPTLAEGDAGDLTGIYKGAFTWEDGASGGSSIGTIGTSPDIASKKLNWSAIVAGPAWCTKRKVWRSKAGGSILYEHPTSIDDNTTTTLTADNIADTALETTQAPSDHDVPPVGVRCVEVFQNRLWAGGSTAEPNYLYYSRHLNPGIWEEDVNTFSTGGHLIIPADENDQIRALQREGMDLIVFQKSRFVVVMGVSPLNFAYRGGHISIGSLAVNGIVRVENGLVFPSLDGIYAYQSRYAFIISDDVTPLLTPARILPKRYVDICGAWFDHRLHLAYCDEDEGSGINNAVLVFDTKNRFWSRFTNLNINALCHWTGEGDAGEVYYADPTDGYIQRYLSGATDNGTGIAFAVESRDYVPIALGVGKVFKETGIYFSADDGALRIDYSVDAGNATGNYSESDLSGATAGIFRRIDFNLPNLIGEKTNIKVSSTRSSVMKLYGIDLMAFKHEERWRQ